MKVDTSRVWFPSKVVVRGALHLTDVRDSLQLAGGDSNRSSDQPPCSTLLATRRQDVEATSRASTRSARGGAVVRGASRQAARAESPAQSKGKAGSVVVFDESEAGGTAWSTYPWWGTCVQTLGQESLLGCPVCKAPAHGDRVCSEAFQRPFPLRDAPAATLRRQVHQQRRSIERVDVITLQRRLPTFEVPDGQKRSPVQLRSCRSRLGSGWLNRVQGVTKLGLHAEACKLVCVPSSSSWRHIMTGLPTSGTLLETRMGSYASGAGHGSSKATCCLAPSSLSGSTLS
eukprot:516001-Rhodomonas_salina.2